MEKPTDHGVHRKSKLVLVIDDSRDLLLLHRLVLEMDGFKVLTAASGNEALNCLSEIKPPDLILLDMRMPEMSGPEFLNILEERMPEIVRLVPIVFLSAMDTVPTSKAVGFIRKPVDINQLVQDVHRYIAAGTPAK